MAPYSRMDRQDVVRLIRWWEAMIVISQRELFQEHLVRLLLLLKMKRASIISYAAALLRSIMKKFMICLEKIQRPRWIWRKVLKKGFLLKICCRSKLIASPRWSTIWILGSKVEQFELQAWMLNPPGLIVSSPFILIHKRMMKKVMKNTKHLN